MARALKVAFKELTRNDFYRINSLGLARGGGQAYIDFNVREISLAQWDAFFHGIAIKTKRAQGRPAWTFPVHNLGPGLIQPEVTVYQRRDPSVSIGSQKLPQNSLAGNRLIAWRPEYGFPTFPNDAATAEEVPAELIRRLRIFLIRDDEDRIWAGWTRRGVADAGDERLRPILESSCGMVELEDVTLDLSEPNWPFVLPHAQAGAADQPAAPAAAPAGSAPAAPPPQAGADAAPDTDHIWDEEDFLPAPEKGITYSPQQVRDRNKAAANAVRKLYSGCQITGDTHAFQTKKGKPYLEVHHLIPLGRGGADAAHNMVVVSAHVHKMLHHAEVSEIDLTKIADCKLGIAINGVPYTITWHPKHAEVVLAHHGA